MRCKATKLFEYKYFRDDFNDREFLNYFNGYTKRVKSVDIGGILCC